MQCPCAVAVAVTVVVETRGGVPGSRNFHPRKLSGLGVEARPCRSDLTPGLHVLGRDAASGEENWMWEQGRAE